MIIENFIIDIARLINIVLTLLVWLIIGRALISWFSPNPYNPLFQFLFRVTEPILSPIRNVMPYLGGVDISPIIVLLAIEFFKSFIVSTLLDLAYQGF